MTNLLLFLFSYEIKNNDLSKFLKPSDLTLKKPNLVSVTENSLVP